MTLQFCQNMNYKMARHLIGRFRAIILFKVLDKEWKATTFFSCNWKKQLKKVVILLL